MLLQQQMKLLIHIAKWVDIWYFIYHIPHSLEECGGVRIVQPPQYVALGF